MYFERIHHIDTKPQCRKKDFFETADLQHAAFDCLHLAQAAQQFAIFLRHMATQIVACDNESLVIMFIASV